MLAVPVLGLLEPVIGLPLALSIFKMFLKLGGIFIELVSSVKFLFSTNIGDFLAH